MVLSVYPTLHIDSFSTKHGGYLGGPSVQIGHNYMGLKVQAGYLHSIPWSMTHPVWLAPRVRAMAGE